jgi:hypothetical protein
MLAISGKAAPSSNLKAMISRFGSLRLRAQERVLFIDAIAVGMMGRFDCLNKIKAIAAWPCPSKQKPIF